MKDFRGPVPLTDADYAAVRRNVLAAMKPRPRFSLAFRLSFAAILVTFAALLTPRPEAPVPMSVERAKLIAEIPAPVTNHQPLTTVSRSTQHAARRTRPAPVPPPPPPVRIEIQTADPDVRIIWIANQTVSTEENS